MCTWAHEHASQVKKSAKISTCAGVASHSLAPDCTCIQRTGQPAEQWPRNSSIVCTSATAMPSGVGQPSGPASELNEHAGTSIQRSCHVPLEERTSALRDTQPPQINSARGPHNRATIATTFAPARAAAQTLVKHDAASGKVATAHPQADSWAVAGAGVPMPATAWNSAPRGHGASSAACGSTPPFLTNGASDKTPSACHSPAITHDAAVDSQVFSTQERAIVQRGHSVAMQVDVHQPGKDTQCAARGGSYVHSTDAAGGHLHQAADRSTCSCASASADRAQHATQPDNIMPFLQHVPAVHEPTGAEGAECTVHGAADLSPSGMYDEACSTQVPPQPAQQSAATALASAVRGSSADNADATFAAQEAAMQYIPSNAAWSLQLGSQAQHMSQQSDSDQAFGAEVCHAPRAAPAPAVGETMSQLAYQQSAAGMVQQHGDGASVQPSRDGKQHAGLSRNNVQDAAQLSADNLHLADSHPHDTRPEAAGAFALQELLKITNSSSGHLPSCSTSW